MQKLRSLHLYAGCLFAPMLLFFATSGIWMTLGLDRRSRMLTLLSTIHRSQTLKAAGHNLTSPLLRCFILLMAAAFIGTVILGVIMALKYGRNRPAAVACLFFGILVPVAIILLHLLA